MQGKEGVDWGPVRYSSPTACHWTPLDVPGRNCIVTSLGWLVYSLSSSGIKSAVYPVPVITWRPLFHIAHLEVRGLPTYEISPHDRIVTFSTGGALAYYWPSYRCR